MGDYVVCLDKNNQIICWGDMYSCDKYISQLYSITENDVIYKEYSISDIYSSSYEDYEVFNVEGTNVYLTLGEIKLVREGCQDETRGIRYIQDELDKLIDKSDVFSRTILDELKYFRNFMDDVLEVHAKYNKNNIFINLDIDALRSAHQMDRENQGLPTIFIK